MTPPPDRQLRALWEKNYSVYGRRKLWKAAQAPDIDVGRDQVARLMREQGICGATRAKKRFTTKADPDPRPGPGPREPGLHRASRPDALWVADFTYCSTWSGIVYVAFIIDVYSRRLVGWKAARSMTTALVLDALNMAAWTRRHTSLDGLICHTDAGSQYTSMPTPTGSTRWELPLPSGRSATATTTPWPNRSWASSRPSSTATRPPWPPTADPGRASTTSRSPPAPWVSWFNEERLHSELDDRTPAEVEADYRHKSQPDAA